MHVRFRTFILVLGILIFLLIAQDMLSQCPMCKMAAESNLRTGGTAGKGLNRGILYMFSLPYLIVGTIAYLWWRNQKKLRADSE